MTKRSLQLIINKMDEMGYGDLTFCPETMGKFNQLGSLDEVLALCGIDERLVPCIDFGHLNARTLGGLKTADDFRQVLDGIKDALGEDRMRRFHAHFSKIEYTEKGGEKLHLTFEDSQFGPNFEPLAEVIVQYGCSPVIICESAGTQAEDAATMKQMYEAELQRQNRIEEEQQ